LQLHALKVEVRHVKSSASVGGSSIVDVEAEVFDKILHALVATRLGEAMQEQVLSRPDGKVPSFNFPCWEQSPECVDIVKNYGILAGAAAANQEVQLAGGVAGLECILSRGCLLPVLAQRLG
jgi:hypothetical protein